MIEKNKKKTQIFYIRKKEGASLQTPQALKGWQRNCFTYEELCANKFYISGEVDEYYERHTDNQTWHQKNKKIWIVYVS